MSICINSKSDSLRLHLSISTIYESQKGVPFFIWIITTKEFRQACDSAPAARAPFVWLFDPCYIIQNNYVKEKVLSSCLFHLCLHCWRIEGWDMSIIRCLNITGKDQRRLEGLSVPNALSICTVQSRFSDIKFSDNLWFSDYFTKTVFHFTT